MRYNNYHKHTHYSNIRTLDCISKPEDYIKRALELGHTTYFTTEHGYQGNIYEAQTLCEKYGLKCIYGVEAYYVDDMNDKSSRNNYHIILIAMTDKARKEINRIMSLANTEGFYYKPRIDLKCLLSLTPTDTIITTACVAGRMFKSKKKIKKEIIGYEKKYEYLGMDKNENPMYKELNEDDLDKPIFQEVEYNDEKSWLNDFLIPVHNHFKDNFYLEVQSHNEPYQIKYNKMLLKVKEKFGIKLIHANDSHYILPEDAKYRDLFLKAKGIFYEEENNFILDYPSYDTIVKRYKEQGVLNDEEIYEALNNTLVFDNAEGIHINKEFKIPKIKKDILQQELHNSNFDYNNDNLVLKEIIKRAWSKEKGLIRAKRIPEYEQSIYYETNIVQQCGMARYFILDHIIVKRAIEKYNAVITRSGRGSAVSFYINKLLGLTEVDRIAAPITLYPTRFMSAERILSSKSLPDIDLNFSSVEPVIKASKDILGEEGIYYMVAYKPLQESSAFRLWCKAKGYHIDEYNEIAKNLDDYVEDKRWKNVIEESKIFRGVIESISPSPCSFLLLDKPIPDEVGLIKVGDVICCALDGYNCDVYKYLKNDYLTVKVYEIIDRVYKLIGRPIDDINTLIKNCDDSVWDIYANALTTTINQSDSDFAKQTLKRYKPTSLSEMSAWVAAIRPGFASLLNTFLDRLPYTTGVKELDDILKDSFHFMMYQESIMKYLVWLGIEEKGTYDIIKKIAKKKFKEEELKELQDKLKKGWINNVGTIDGFSETWQVVQDAAHYSFNACISGDTIIQRAEIKKNAFNPTVEEMYLIKNDIEYAKKTGHINLHNKYATFGYGNALSMYDDERIRRNKIVDIRLNGIKEIYRVKTKSGAFLDCTMNHKFPTPNGKIKLEDLKIGDLLYVKGTYKRYSDNYRLTDKNYISNTLVKKGIPTFLDEIISIEYLRTDNTYDIEMEHPAHTYVSESGLVTSNSHSLSVAIDSMYGAYLKSHYPLEYFTVVLTLYAGDMDRTSKLINELPYFNIKLKPIKYGKSGANYTLDKQNNAIYKGISSVKYCNSQIANELLELSKNNYDTFIDLLKDIKEKTSVNSKQLTILISLNFFEIFGKNKQLLEIAEIYDKFADIKVISKKKMESLGLSEYLMKKYAGKETKNQYRDLDNQGLINELCSNIKNESLGVVEQIKADLEYLEYTDYKNDKMADCYWIVIDYTAYKDETRPHFTLRNIKTGEEIKTRIKQTKVYRESPFGLFSVLDIKKFVCQNKSKLINGKWEKTDELEPILEEYSVIKK